MNEHIDPVTGKRYRYTNGRGKQFEITMGAQDPDGKWKYTTSDDMVGYWDPSEVGSLELISEAEPQSTGAQASEAEPQSTGAQTSMGEAPSTEAQTSEAEPQSTEAQTSEAEPQSTGGAVQNYDGLMDMDFSYLDEAPGSVALSDSDWLAQLAPDTKNTEKSLKAKKAIDALNMVSQAVQVLGRMPNTHLGAGGAQPMVPDAYQKYMDRVYEQGQRYDTSIAAREKVLNAGKKLQMDWAMKREKMQLDRELFRLKKEKADAVARQDKQKEAYIDAQIEYVKAKKAAVDAGVEMKRDLTDAQLNNYQNLMDNRDRSTEIKAVNAKNKGKDGKKKNEDPLDKYSDFEVK